MGIANKFFIGLTIFKSRLILGLIIVVSMVPSTLILANGTLFRWASGLEGAPTMMVTASTSSHQNSPVPLYGQFETEVLNLNPYTNPFDFEEITLEASFQAPSGHTIPFFGFYDGDGQGGQSGTVWKLRFMPDEIGAWSYMYTWSDGTPGGSGGFDVQDTGLPGPMGADETNSKIWEVQGQANIIPFFIAVPRPYDTIHDPRLPSFLNYIDVTLEANGVAFALVNQIWQDCADDSTCSPTNPTFALANWEEIDNYLQELQTRDLGVNLMLYSDDGERPRFNGQSTLERLLLKYAVARLAAYPFISFDSGIDILEYRSSAWNDWFAQELLALDPWDHPVGSRHGGGSGNFTCTNCTYDSRGEVHPNYGNIRDVMQNTTQPVFFTDRWREDYSRGNFDSESIRKIMWHSGISGGPGFMIGGKHAALQLDDYSTDLDAPWQLQAFSNFWHQRIRSWNTFTICNGFVTNGHCLGESGETYIIYLENGQPTDVDLSSATGVFTVEWLNPRTGVYTAGAPIAAGGIVTLLPPEGDLEDWVLHLTKLQEPILSLSGVPADRAIHLNWFVFGTTPLTMTWQIAYDGPSGDQPSPILDLLNGTRAYTLTGMTNYNLYTVTLNGMLGSTPFLTDTLASMPSDQLTYFPMILR